MAFRILYDIGYEKRNPNQLVGELVDKGVGLVVDVRCNAWSHNPRYCAMELTELLGEVGIRYIHLPELGVISSIRKGRNQSQLLDFIDNEFEGTIRSSPAKMKLIRRIAATVRKKESVALLCMEHETWRCHRRIVAKLVNEVRRS